MSPLVGVLALQGDVVDHCRALEAVGARSRTVRRPEELVGLDGLVLPGGESSTIDRLSRRFGVREPLVAALRAGGVGHRKCSLCGGHDRVAPTEGRRRLCTT